VLAPFGWRRVVLLPRAEGSPTSSPLDILTGQVKRQEIIGRIFNDHGKKLDFYYFIFSNLTQGAAKRALPRSANLSQSHI